MIFDNPKKAGDIYGQLQQKALQCIGVELYLTQTAADDGIDISRLRLFVYVCFSNTNIGYIETQRIGYQLNFIDFYNYDDRTIFQHDGVSVGQF